MHCPFCKGELMPNDIARGSCATCCQRGRQSDEGREQWRLSEFRGKPQRHRKRGYYRVALKIG